MVTSKLWPGCMLEGAEVELVERAAEIDGAVEAARIGVDGVGLVAVAVEVGDDRRLADRDGGSPVSIADGCTLISGLSAMVCDRPAIVGELAGQERSTRAGDRRDRR